jgi:hypothetical protein
MRQGKGQENKIAFGNEEVGQTNKRKEEKLAGTSIEDAIRRSSHATFISSTNRRTYSRKAKKKMA